LFGLQSISLWLNLSSVRIIPVFLPLSVCSICFGLVEPAVANTHALYVKSGQCIRRSVWFIGWVTPSASVISRFELLSMQKLLYSILRWQIIVIQGASGTLDWFALIKLILFVVCAYAPLATRLWRLDRRVEVWL